MATPIVPFRDVLRLGTKGTQPVAVKRGLWRAGFRGGWSGLDDQAIAEEVLGPLGVDNLRSFQQAEGLSADGVYGPRSHAMLRKHFDAYARELYELEPPPPMAKLQLPAAFLPTHGTAGLSGYPAIDVFARPGTTVGAPVAGRIRRLSGKDPAVGGSPGGAYGWSIYLTANHADYYMTHFGSRRVNVGDWVDHGQIIGTVCDAKVSGKSSSTSHIHEGKRDL